MVGAKADGTRAFLLFSFLTEEDYDYVALVDRTGACEVVQVSVPSDYSEYHCGTLLDGELVTLPDGTREYLVFDAVTVSGYPMKEKSHSERHAEVIRIVNTISSPLLRIRVKPWFEVGEVGYKKVCDSIAPHKSDGLIFVPEKGMPLMIGRQSDHFKWKCAQDHTIDFLLHNETLWLETRGVRVNAHTHLNIMGLHNPNNHTGVIECSMMQTDVGWIATVVRPRPDKLHPNDSRVAEYTLRNILENIDVSELLPN